MGVTTYDLRDCHHRLFRRHGHRSNSIWHGRRRRTVKLVSAHFALTSKAPLQLTGSSGALYLAPEQTQQSVAAMELLIQDKVPPLSHHYAITGE